MGDLLNDEKIDFNYMPPHNSLNFFSRLGEKNFVRGFVNLAEFGSFLGEFLIKSVRILFNPANLRFREFSNYIKDGGVNAVSSSRAPLFLIGVVLAYLGSAMLASFWGKYIYS